MIMRKFDTFFLISVSLAFCWALIGMQSGLLAASDGGIVATSTATSTPVPAPVPVVVVPVVAPTPVVPVVGDLLTDFKEVDIPVGNPLDEVKSLRTEYARLKAARQQHLDRQGWIVLIAGFLAAVLKVALSILTRYSGLIGRHTKKLPAVCGVMGVALMLLLKLAGGTDWMTAVMFGLAGPSAVFATEFQKMLKKQEAGDAVETTPVSAAPPTPVDPKAS